MEFYEKYFSINLKDYANIGIDLEINKILFIFLVASIAAIISINYIKSSMHIVIKTLTRHEAVDEDSSKTLKELGLDKKRIRSSISSNAQLKRAVSIVGQTKYTYEEYIKLTKKKDFRDEISFDEAKLYINPEERDLASKICEEKSPTVIETVLMCLLMTAIFVCLMFFMPSILTFINNLIG